MPEVAEFRDCVSPGSCQTNVSADCRLYRCALRRKMRQICRGPSTTRLLAHAVLVRGGKIKYQPEAQARWRSPPVDARSVLGRFSSSLALRVSVGRSFSRCCLSPRLLGVQKGRLKTPREGAAHWRRFRTVRHRDSHCHFTRSNEPHARLGKRRSHALAFGLIQYLGTADELDKIGVPFEFA